MLQSFFVFLPGWLRNLWTKEKKKKKKIKIADFVAYNRLETWKRYNLGVRKQANFLFFRKGEGWSVNGICCEKKKPK